MTVPGSGGRALSQLCCLLFLFIGPLFLPQAQADTVRLSNGQVLTGEVIRISGSIIELRCDGKAHFISLSRLHPEDRAQLEKQHGLPSSTPAPPPEQAAPPQPAPRWDLSSQLAGLSDGDPTIREKAIVALQSFGTSAVPPLADFLEKNASTQPRIEACEALARIGDRRAVPPLKKLAFSTNTAQELREKAGEALHRLGYDGAVDPLIEQLGSKTKPVRLQALRVMRKMPSVRMFDPVLARLNQQLWFDNEELPLLSEILAGMGPSVVPLLLEASSPPGKECTDALIRAMGYVEDPLITRRLVQFVRQLEENGVLKEAAFESLAQIGSAEAVEAIIEPMCRVVENDDSGNSDSIWAILLLGELGDRRAVEPLIHALKRESEPSGSQYFIAESLVRIGDRRAVRPLLAKLRSPNMEMRGLAAQALGDLGDPASLKPLMSLMVYLDDDLRQTAAEGIGKIGDLRTAGVLIAYLNTADDDSTYAPLVGLGEMGGARVHRAIKDRISREPADGMTAYHGTKALETIENAGTAEAEVSATATSLWHLCCWIGFVGRWVLIVFILFRMISDPARTAGDREGRKLFWFERYVLLVLIGLCSIRLLYVLIFHLNPAALRLAAFAGMPLGRYILCAVMDPVVILLIVRGILRHNRWGWTLLLTYLPAAILLSLYDYGYWTATMLVSAGCGVAALGTWALAKQWSRRPVKVEPETDVKVFEHPRLTKTMLTALVVLNSIRLIFIVAMSAAFSMFFMTWGWDMLSLLLGVIAAAVGGVVDAAVMFLVNKLVLKLVCRIRAGRVWLQHTIDTVTGLVLGGLCVLAFGTFVVSAIGESESIVQMLLQTGTPLLLIGVLSAYPVMLVWKNREQGLLRYFVIMTIVAYLIAQPLALFWLSTS